MPIAFKTVALIGRYKSRDVAGPLLELGNFLSSRGCAVLVDDETVDASGVQEFPAATYDDIGQRADLAVVLGGDGSMLSAARALAPFGVPLVGVNQGRLGFLTDISVGNMLHTIGEILDGKYITEERMLLAAQVFRGGVEVFDVRALNDACITKGADGGLIELEVRIDGSFVYLLRADGLIVSTPTGSTAYALSAGGPILHPSLSAFAIVPVCPHTLSNRPIAVSSDVRIEVLMHRCADARVHFDSHSHSRLQEQDRIVVQRYARSIRLLHPVGHNYFHMLREKLHWSEAL